MRPARQFSRFRLYSGGLLRPRPHPLPNLLSQSTERRFRSFIRKRSLGNDRTQLLQRVPQNVQIFRLQEADEVRPVDPGLTAREGHGYTTFGKATRQVASEIGAPAERLGGPDDEDEGQHEGIDQEYEHADDREDRVADHGAGKTGDGGNDGHKDDQPERP